MSLSTKKIFKILVANGVNLDLLGHREPALYGRKSLADINEELASSCSKFYNYFAPQAFELVFDFFQSNDESAFIQKLEPGLFDGMLVNAGAWTHTSLAIADRLRGLGVPYVEVHLSEISQREDYRHRSLLASAARGRVSGLGASVYQVGIFALLKILLDPPHEEREQAR